MVEHDNIAIEIGVPVDRRPPQGIRVGAFPRNRDREYRGNEPSDAGFRPSADVVFADEANGIRAILERHARHSHALMFRRAAVVAEEEIEETAVLIQNDGEVAMAAREKPVLRTAIEGVAGCKHDAKVGKV